MNPKDDRPLPTRRSTSLGVSNNTLRMKSSLIIGLLFIGSNPLFAAVHTIKPETTFHSGPSGETIHVVPSMVETPPLQSENGWCLFKLKDGRGTPIHPPTGWAKCNSLEHLIGN